MISRNDETVAGHCRGCCDESEMLVLEENCPVFSFFEDEPTDVYGRSIYYSDREKEGLVCHQYLLVWPDQKGIVGGIGYHLMDYAPVFVYRTGGPYSVVIFDIGHYVIQRRFIPSGRTPRLDVANSWHSFKFKDDEPIEKGGQSVLPLREQIVREWWEREPHSTTLKIVENLKDPIRLLGLHDFDDPPFSMYDRATKGLAKRVPHVRRYLDWWLWDRMAGMVKPGGDYGVPWKTDEEYRMINKATIDFDKMMGLVTDTADKESISAKVLLMASDAEEQVRRVLEVSSPGEFLSKYGEDDDEKSP